MDDKYKAYLKEIRYIKYCIDKGLSIYNSCVKTISYSCVKTISYKNKSGTLGECL
jgi:hypothetical protein